jgi:hypothetical protein
MYVSELKKLLDIGCNHHLTLQRASGETTKVPDEMKILVPHFTDEGSFIGYKDAYAYYDPDLFAFVIEQQPLYTME